MNALARFREGEPPGEPGIFRLGPRHPDTLGATKFGRAKLLLSRDGQCRLRRASPCRNDARPFSRESGALSFGCTADRCEIPTERR